ncbi:hypothetical protein RCJ22_13440 [Vibrio sp. FNV 38]|nr:hypothetical protein [Vibrio sp. FNV 38]
MIDMEKFSKSMEFNQNGMHLLLVDYITQYRQPIDQITSLCEREDYFELMMYTKKLKMTLALFSDEDTPVKLAKLEHLAKHEFYPPEDLIHDIKLDLAVIQNQIKQLVQ